MKFYVREPVDREGVKLGYLAVVTERGLAWLHLFDSGASGVSGAFSPAGLRVLVAVCESAARDLEASEVRS